MFKRIENLCKLHKITPAELARQCGYSKETFYKQKKNGGNLSVENIVKIADYFNVSLDFLITGKEKNVSRTEMKIINHCRKFPADKQGILCEIITVLAKLNEIKPN